MSKEANDTMRDDYDFSQGVRGKYRHFMGRARTLKVRHPDGTFTTETIQPFIELDPDVRRYFPDSEAVNKALRGLIELIPDASSEPPGSAT
jgi:hypothetical protein